MAGGTLTLLHLSNLHFGIRDLDPGGGLEEELRHEALFSSLHQDLRGLQESIGVAPDVVVVSGDLTMTGSAVEFSRALEFLEQLTEPLGLGHRRVVIVPGNHDVSWKLCESYFLRCDATGEEPVPPYWPNWEPFAEFLSTFYAKVSSANFTEERPWTLFELPELCSVVVGLNSTMAETHKDHYGWIGEQQLAWFVEQLAPYEKQGWLRVAVLHHSLQAGDPN